MDRVFSPAERGADGQTVYPGITELVPISRLDRISSYPALVTASPHLTVLNTLLLPLVPLPSSQLNLICKF